MKQRIVATALMAAVAGGCMGSRGQPGGGGPKPNAIPTGNVKLPPPPPPPKFVSIDQGLRRDAEAELSKSFSSGDPVVRANAIEATQKISGVSGAPRLIAALTDPAAPVRFAGAMACGTLKLQAAKDRLLTMTGDRNVSVQVAVRFALHRLGDTRLSHDFELLSKDPSASVRANTALALGLLNEPSATNILRPMLADTDRKVRMQVVESMYRLGDDEARNKLVVGSVSVFPDEQIICVLALAGPKKPDVMRYLRAALTAEAPETRLAAARAVGMLGSDDGMTIALKAVDNKDARQRSMAALALGDIGRTDAQDELKDLLRDKEPAVRLAAAAAVLQLKAG